MFSNTNNVHGLLHYLEENMKRKANMALYSALLIISVIVLSCLLSGAAFTWIFVSMYWATLIIKNSFDLIMEANGCG